MVGYWATFCHPTVGFKPRRPEKGTREQLMNFY